MSVVYKDVLERFVNTESSVTYHRMNLHRCFAYHKVMSVKWKWERQESHLIF